MISDKVLGAYAAVGTLAPAGQAEWYAKACNDWKIDTFEIPLLGGVPLAAELVEAFAAGSASLVVTMVAQWATKGQQSPGYGLSSLDEGLRREALLDVQSVIQQCQTLQRAGIGIRALELHTGRRTGSAVAHAVSFARSLQELGQAVAEALPECELAVEVTDSLPPEHPIAFPGAKKASLTTEELIEAVAAVNRSLSGRRISLVLNWGRLLINGDRPFDVVEQVLGSPVPLGGVILSGANPTPTGLPTPTTPISTRAAASPPRTAAPAPGRCRPPATPASSA